MPPLAKRIILVVLTLLLCVSESIVTYAQSNSDALRNANQQLREKESIVEQKKQEQQSVNKEIENIQSELDSLLTYIDKNKEEMTKTQSEIDEVNKLIEQKKEEIVVLEDKILGRKDIMKKRAVALQQNGNISMFINLFFESDSIAEFLQRASAASALMDADKEILTAQKQDLLQIEQAKQVIDQQEKVLEEQQQVLAQQQAELDQNLQKRQQTLAEMQAKYNQITQQVALAEQEKAGIESQMRDIQARINVEQSGARAAQGGSAPQNDAGAAIKGKEMYVKATAYTPYDSGHITAAGYNIMANPNMKLIAVDPRVIPLGKRVWVEGYGVAIAGDTGGAIKGHKIDVLLPTKAQAYAWGIKNVKIIVLD